MVSNILKLTLVTTALLASACAKTETTAAVEKTADTVSATAQVVESKRIARGGNIVAVSEEGGKKYIVGPNGDAVVKICLLYTSPSPRDATLSRMPSSA